MLGDVAVLYSGRNPSNSQRVQPRSGWLDLLHIQGKGQSSMKRIHYVLISFAVLATALPANARPVERLVPTRGAYFGAYVGMGRTIGGYEEMIGRKLDINHHVYDWNDPFPTFRETEDVRADRIPLITWEPWCRGSSGSYSCTSLAKIASGAEDRRILIPKARDIRSFRRTVMIRWGHEMNGDWKYPWQGARNGQDASVFVRAWRHIHDVFRRQGVSNVVWVWAPNHNNVPNRSWNHWSKYYPGDAYVDWVGISGYNWGTSRPYGGWQEFKRIFRPVYDYYRRRKPIMIAEVGTVEEGGSKANWFYRMKDDIRREFRGIGAVIYLHNGNFRVDSSSSALSAYRGISHARWFKPPNVFCRGEVEWAGGVGDDTIKMAGTADRGNGLGGRDQIWGYAGADNLCGNGGGDRLLGGRGNDYIAGGSGSDRLSGGPGQDLLQAGDDDDLVRGHRGGDRLRGSGGNDHLFDGRGRDEVDGGSGFDVWHRCDDGVRDQVKNVERIVRDRAC